MEKGTWSALLDELQDTIARLSQQLDGRDAPVRLQAAERHRLERALDRYQAATDAVTRHVDSILARSTSRPRR